MQTREQNQDNPLRHLTRAQFMALGGNAVVVSADGSPLMVADTQDAVSDWLSERNFGIVALH